MRQTLVALMCILVSMAVQSAKFEMTTVIQVEPTMLAHKKMRQFNYNKVTQEKLESMVFRAAGHYFSSVKRFSPDEPANYFLIVGLTHGSYFAGDYGEVFIPDKNCVTIKFESDSVGVSGCDADVDDAIDNAFDAFYANAKGNLKTIEKSGRIIRWLDAVDRAVVYSNDGKMTRIKRHGNHGPGGFKKNVRVILSQYFQDDYGRPISFFRSEDLIFVILSSRDNAIKHKDFLVDIINKTRKNHKQWPYYMHQAVRNNAPTGVIEAMLNKKKSYDDFLDADSNTPLMKAIAEGNIGLSEYLVKNGSDPKKLNNKSLGGIHFSIPIMILRKDFSILDFVLALGGDINAVSAEGVFPIAVAVGFNSGQENPVDSIKLIDGFIKRGAKIDLPLNAVNKAFSPLMQASYHNNTLAAKYLLSLGANTDHHPDGRETPLHMAAYHGNLELVKLMLKSGAKTNVKTSEGKSALHYAYPTASQKLSNSVRQIVELLILHGEDPSLTDNTGMTAENAYVTKREFYLEEKRRLVHEKHLREIKAEREREIAAVEKQARLDEKRERESNGFNWGKALAMTAGFVAGNGLALDAEAQIETITGIIRDSQAGVQGISNTTGALNDATQRYQASSPIGTTTSYKAPSSAKPHYADRIHKSELRSCNFKSVQANSFCKVANKYYERYLVANGEGLSTREDIYSLHMSSVRSLDDLLRNSKNSTTLDLSKPVVGASNLNLAPKASGSFNSAPSGFKDTCGQENKNRQACVSACPSSSVDPYCPQRCAKKYACSASSGGSSKSGRAIAN